MANETLGGVNRLFSPGGRGGVLTLNGTTPVVVANRFVGPNSVINTTLKSGSASGTPAARTITSVTAGVGFTIVGTAGDTNQYNYKIFG